jgi:hypothetical protein
MNKTFFGAMVLAVSLVGVASADDQVDAKAILDAGIKAQGGEALLSKFTAVHSKTKGNWHDGDKKIPVSYESFFDGSDKSRLLSFGGDNRLTSIEVINGKEGWEKDGDQETETLSGDKLESLRENEYVNWVYKRSRQDSDCVLDCHPYSSKSRPKWAIRRIHRCKGSPKLLVASGKCIPSWTFI